MRLTAGPNGAVPAGKLRVTVTSLEMRQRPEGAPLPAPSADVMIDRQRDITVAFYRHLYDTVGEPWLWGDRRKLSDAELGAIIGDPQVEVHLAMLHDQPAGFAELDRRTPGEVELAYFGILPQFIGRKLGPFLLSHAIDLAWRSAPERVWVHTCNLDHPAALGVYQRAGFVVFNVHEELADDPRVLGLIPEDVAPQHPIVR